MKRFGFFLLMLLTISACTRVEPGYEGIVVNLYGSDRGVSNLPLRTGMVWYNLFTESVFQYPTFVQTAVWTKDTKEGSPNNEEMTFNSKEGLVISGDISLSYQLAAKKVPAFYVKFRSDNLGTFTHGFLRNIARDAMNEVASTYDVADLYGPRKEEFLKKVRNRINSQVEEFGVKLQQFGFIGAPRLPKQVVNSLNAKIQATQDAIRAENQVRQATAEARKQVAKAKGEAAANNLLTKSITPELLQWRRLAITEQAVSRWDGHRPTVEGADSGLLLSITPNR